MIEDFDKDSQRKKDKGDVTAGSTEKQKEDAFSEFSLQELIGTLESNPSLIKKLPSEMIVYIRDRIGNQRLEAILGGGRPLLRGKVPEFAPRETAINDISTGTPQLIELGGE